MVAQRVLITGGASGLGRALTEQYLDRGDKVLFTDINSERAEQTLAELRGRGDVHFLRADVCRDQDWTELVDWTRDQWDGLDVLVNNAGVAASGRFDRIPIEDWDWIIEINLKSVVRGCRAFVPMMKQQRNGYLVNIASLAAFGSIPAMSSYNVTKCAVVSLSETLRYELAPYGIKTTVACPAFFQSNLAESLRSTEPSMHQTVRKLLSRGKLTAEQVAKILVQAQLRGRFLVLPQPVGRQLYFTKRFLPFLFSRELRRLASQYYKKFEENQ
jgi:NAD(P)-dependent dehydrogenase (short-subunit alcohol dehydrogenase family)